MRRSERAGPGGLVLVMVGCVLAVATAWLLVRRGPLWGVAPLAMLGVWAVLQRPTWLVGLTALILMLTATHYPEIRGLLEEGRWVPFLLMMGMVAVEIVHRHDLSRSLRTFDGWILAWLAWAGFSAFYSVDPGRTVLHVGSLGVAYLAIFWALWSHVQRVGPADLLDAILAAAFFVYVAGALAFLVTPDAAMSAARFRGILENPNTLGLLTAILLPIAVHRARVTRQLWHRALVGIMIVSLIFSGSRTAFAATLIGLGFYWWKTGHRWLWAAGLAGAGGLGLLVITHLAAPAWLDIPYLRFFVLESQRPEAWRAAGEIISARPLLGHGFGTEEMLFDQFGIRLPFFPGRTFHNSYLGIVSQVGILGGAAFFLPLVALAASQTRETPKRASIEAALTATLLAGLAAAVTESWIYVMGNAYAFPFWFAVMLLLQYRDRRKGGGGGGRRSRLDTRRTRAAARRARAAAGGRRPVGSGG